LEEGDVLLDREIDEHVFVADFVGVHI